MKKYKSPVAALLWSLTMPGFGQFYNGQYFFGALLFIVEIVINVLGGINMSIYLAFAGDFLGSHRVLNIEWTLFYPSLYFFSIWHAYNKAIVLNYQKDEKEAPQETYLTGLFFGFVLGMNLGVYWHAIFISIDPQLFFASPIFSGLVWGLIIGLVGHFIERYKKREGKK